MGKAQFRTIPDELLHVAEGVLDYLRTHGFVVHIEKAEVDHPRTAAFTAKRGHTVLFVEVSSSFDQTLADHWVRYGRSCGSDVQFAMALPNAPGASQQALEYSTRHKVGIFTVDVDGICTEIVQPLDLAMHVELPELSSFPRLTRQKLAPIYRKFDRGDWRDGLADGCLAVEELARKYLKHRSSQPGVSILGKNGRPTTITTKQIEKLTLGQLTPYFLGISTPNSLDSLLAKTIPIINPERIGAVHKKGSARTEKKLRGLTGKRMYAVINCVKALCEKT